MDIMGIILYIIGFGRAARGLLMSLKRPCKAREFAIIV
jgi:hypothetical protein